MSTLPHVAGSLFGGLPWFAARPRAATSDSDVLWVRTPVLPAGPFRWAEDAEVDSEHLTLNLTAIAELLFVSQLDPGGDTSDDHIRDVVLAQVNRCGCDLRRCESAIAFEAGEHPDLAATRMTWCLALADRLIDAGM